MFTISIVLLSIAVAINFFFTFKLARFAKISGQEMARNLRNKTPIAVGREMKILSKVQDANFILSILVFSSMALDGSIYFAVLFVAMLWIANAIYNKEFLDLSEKACGEALNEF